MTGTNLKNSNDLLIKMIKEQQYWIEWESERVTKLAELIINYLEQIKIESKNVSDEVITHPLFDEINRKLGLLSIALEKVNFKKGLTRDYKHQWITMKKGGIPLFYSYFIKLSKPYDWSSASRLFAFSFSLNPPT